MSVLFVPREHRESETRIAATPETVGRFIKNGLEILVQANAGEAAHIPDGEFQAAGATVVPEAEVSAAWSRADIVLTVGCPTVEEVSRLKEGCLVMGFLAPHRMLDEVRAMRERGVSSDALEFVRRISRAQSMDALSSQASLAGYKAVLLAAARLDKYFPLLMTAAGTVKPARVVIMGAGVAGLQALATAKRLGAVVEVSDIREEVREQVESRGGRFIDLPDMGESGDGEGGYAREVTPEFLKQQQAIVAKHVKVADVVVSTAAVPGRPAPKLITEAMVESMRQGSVIVDMAATSGGNCVLTVLGEEVVRHGVLIVGIPNLARTVPGDASVLLARNLLALLNLALDEGQVKLDLDDEIIAHALVTYQGEVIHAPTAALLQEGGEG